MEWIAYVIYFIVMAIVSYLAARQAMKNRGKNKPLDESDVDIPQVAEGTPQAVLHGDTWTSGWTVLGYGSIGWRGVKYKGQTAYYEYDMGILMGLWRGPINMLRYITAQDVYLWSGAMSNSGAFYINSREVFGGNHKQGGVSGRADLAMGHPDQMPNPRAVQGLKHNLPAFRGRTTIYYYGYIAANSLTPNPWSVRGHRTTAGWANDDCWYPEKCEIQLRNDHDAIAFRQPPVDYARAIFAKNAVHVLYEAYTDPLWGKRKDRADMDDASWRAAADQVYAEGLGFCINWQISDDINSFVQSLCDHAGCVVFTSVKTKKITIRLFRDDYDVNTIPHFEPGKGLLSIDEITESSLSEAISEVIVKWHDPLNNLERSTRQQNLGLLQSTSVISQESDYPFLPTIELANRIASRDLRAQGMGTRKYTLVLDRVAATLEVGDPISISSPAHGVVRDILRAIELDRGSSEDGHVKVVAVQDVFGLPSTTYALPQGSNWETPENGPGVITDFLIFERPYQDLVKELGQPTVNALTVGSGYLSTVAVRPTDTSSRYVVQSKRAGETAFIPSGTDGPFTERGIVSSAVTTRQPLTLNLGDIDTTRLAIGSLALWDDEIVQILDITDQIVQIDRACCDTVPVPHALGSSIWFFDNATADVDRSFASETVSLQMIAFAGTEGLDPALAGVHTGTVAGRLFRPYPPGDVRVAGVPFGEGLAATGGDVVTWVNRNRLTQGANVVGHEGANIAPEAGTTHNIVVRDSSGNIVQQLLGTTATQLTLDPMTGADTRSIELWSTRGGLDSLQRHLFTIDFSDNMRVTDDNSLRITDSGDPRVTE